MKQYLVLSYLSGLLVLLLVSIIVFGRTSVHAAPAPSTLDQSRGTSHDSRISSSHAHPNDMDLSYHGGPIMPGTSGIVNVYPIYWFPGSGIPNEDQYISLINRYYTDVGGNRLYNILSQYTGGNGALSSAALGGSWTDSSTPYPDNPLTEADILQEVQSAIENNHWPTSGDNNYFPVYISQTSCSGGHQFGGPLDNPIIYGYIFYPDLTNGHCQLPGTSPNGDAEADVAISISAHEQFEAATDPLGNSSWVEFNGTETLEIGDKCQGPDQTMYGPIDLTGANQHWNGHSYIIQEMWSNKAGGCTQG